MDDETFLTSLMASLPQEEYQATILTLKAKLRENTLSFTEAETLLDDKYAAMIESMAGLMKMMNLHYLWAYLTSRRHLKAHWLLWQI